jgi:TP901 family phage tail tape measure protein
MADLEKTVSIIFSGKDVALGSSLEKISASMDKFNDQVNKTIAPLADFGEKILKIDAALAAVTVGGMAIAIKKAGEFSGSFGEITTLFSATGDQVKVFEKDILNYAGSSSKSIADINSAIYNAVSAGVDWSKSIDFVSASEKLSIAGRADLNTTTKVLVSTLNAYGEGTDKATKYSDIMFTTVKLGQTTLTELSASLAMVTGLAANTGVPFETLSAAVAALTVAGLPTSQAITGLKAAMQNIIKPTSEAEKMAASLGLQFDAAALKTKGLEGVLWDAYKATGGNTAKMAELFGSVEGLNAVLVLASDKTGKFKESLAAMKDVTGATAEAYGKLADESENLNQRIINNIDNVLISIGQKLMPAYKEAGNSLTGLLSSMKAGVDSGAFDPLFDLLEEAGTELSSWMKQLAKAFPEAFQKIDWNGLIDSLESVGSAIDDALGGKDIDAEKLAKAIQMITDTVTSLIDLTHGIGEGLAPFASAVTAIVDGFNRLSPDAKQQLGDVLGIAMGFKVFGPVWGTIMLAMAADTETATKVITFAFNSIDNGINAIKVAVISLGLIFASAAQDAAELLDYIPGYDASEGIARTSDRVKILSEALKDAEDKFDKSSAALLNTGNASDKMASAAAAAAGNVKDLGSELGKIPINTESTVTVNMPVTTAIDTTALAETENAIKDKFGTGTVVQITTNLDGSSTIEAVNKFSSAFPAVKKVEVKPDITQTTIAEIKEKSDIIQKSIEWKAKIDIAQIESSTKTMEAAFKSVNNTVTDTGKTLTSLAGTYATLIQAGQGGTYFMERMIEDENKRRDEALKMQEGLVTAQVDNLKARTQAMQNGQAMIQIDGAGLQPHLEAFMFEVLKAIQVRANAEGAQYLVGL